ncbi:MAG TPA: hypothetical protein VK387_06865 [Thermoleophilaceae bacterium]|nr:hypothetical protein [Thermoleophilaceae bacterium]
MAASTSEQLAWEARAGRFAAAAAALAGLLFVVGSVYFNSTVRERPRGVDQELALLDREAINLLVSGALVALAFLLLAVVLGYLYRVTRHRRPELPAAALPLLVVGTLVAAGSEVGRQVAVLSVAADFASSAPRNAAHARELLRGSTALQVIGIAGLAANFALGLTLGLICINAMRSGVVSAFIGVFGIVLGVFLVVAPPPFRGLVFLLFLFWLLALAALFLDRWPGGRGRAWETGEAAPWPSVSQRNAELERQREALDDRASGDDREADGRAAENGRSGEDERPPGDGAPSAAAEEAGAGTGDGRGGGSGSRSKRKRGRRR